MKNFFIVLNMCRLKSKKIHIGFDFFCGLGFGYSFSTEFGMGIFVISF